MNQNKKIHVTYPPSCASINLLVFKNYDDMLNRLARRWISALRFVKQRPFAIALSGGRSAADLFKTIASQTLEEIAKNTKIANAVKNLHFFWADERCVHPNDPASNFLIANQYLFQPLKIKSSNIHRIRGEIAPNTAAQQAQKELLDLGLPQKNGIPIIDLVILGMGEDGHVASLFPEELEKNPDIINSNQIYRPVVASKPPPNRITLNYTPITNAKRVWVVITGQNKQQALTNSLPPASKTPLGIVLKHRKHTEIFYLQPKTNDE